MITINRGCYNWKSQNMFAYSQGSNVHSIWHWYTDFMVNNNDFFLQTLTNIFREVYILPNLYVRHFFKYSLP